MAQDLHRDIFENPDYWCGELGYRPGLNGIGYQDFPIHQVKVEHILARRPKGKLLDIGCAFGYLVKRLRDKGIDAFGIDISQYALSQSPEDVKPYLKHGSADNLPWSDKYFDMIVTFGTLEHLGSEILPKAISEIKRVAKRGIIAVTPGDDPYFDNDITHQTKQPLSWWRAQFPPGFEVRSDANEEWITGMRRILVISTMIFPVSPENKYAGIETLVRLISNELNHRGHQVSLAAPQGSRLPKGIEHINTGACGDFIESERRAYWIYGPRLREFEAILDLSHSHWAMMENNLHAIAFIWHDPYIMKPQEPSYNVCALSQWQANRFRQIYGYEARVVDPHCGHPGELKPAKGSFLFLGKMGPQKGCLEAIEICHELGVPLDIIGGPGPGDPPEYLEKVRGNCHSGVVYQGEVDDPTKITFLEEAKALIYPINYPPGQGEAHSHKTVDTLLCGCPVVTYNTGAFSELIEHGVTGFLANDREDFKQLMMKVDGLDRKLIREKAVERWSVEATVDRLLGVIDNVSRGMRWGNIARGPTIIKPSAPSAVGYVKYNLAEYPRQIRLDTINICNAKCIPCHYHFQKRSHGKMDIDLLMKILSEVNTWDKAPEEVAPVNFGELFLSENWYEILKLIEEKLPQTRIALPTNGSLLNDDTVEKLASIGTLKWLNFSINAFFRETYEAFTELKAETIDKIKEAIVLLHRMRPDITTCASMIFDTNFQTELERDLFIQFWQPLTSIVSINPAAYCNSPLEKPLIPTKTACRSIFDGLTILYDGKVVTGCCFDAGGVLEIGDVNNQALLEIWGGEKLRQLCELHNKGGRGKIELCSRCSFA